MSRDFLTNKWFIGGVSFLIVFAVACVFWYQHDIAPYKQDAAEAEKLVRQSEIAKKVSETDNKVERATDVTAAESETPTADKTTTKINSNVVENTKTEAQQNETPAENTAATEVRVSPHGFGAYPEVPEDYPTKHLVKWPAHSLEAELLSRVLIKLWSSSEKNFRGGYIENGKVYPYYYDTVYVRFSEYKGADGKMVRYPARATSGPWIHHTRADLLTPPPHLRILDLDSSGIDPYQYLDLP